jgi:hypothetical protein
MKKSTKRSTSTFTKNGKTVTKTIVEETITYPDGREETTTTETIQGDDGGPSETVTKSVGQGEVSEQN